MSDSKKKATIQAALSRQGLLASQPVESTLRSTVASSAADSFAEPGLWAHLPATPVGEHREDVVDLVLSGTIGRGAMGVVDAVWQRSLDREVAIKRLVAKPNRTHVEALLAEAGMMGRLEHPNIVPVHALGACPNRGPLLVMKRVRGIAWSELLKDPEHPAWGAHVEDRLDRNLEILVAICNACHFAHSRGIIHRDIKPQNVMVGDYGEVYLMDWGIATTAESPPSSEVLGSPAYMAPELALGDPVGSYTDVFLLGATLHQILTGRGRNDGTSLLNTLIAAATAEPEVFDASVPRELADICNKACAAEPEQRYPTARALQMALEDFRHHRGVNELAKASERGLNELREVCELALETAEEERRDAAIRAERRFSAVRFGFQEALRQWPECERAQLGLQATLELMMDFEIRFQNVRRAEAIETVLPYPAPHLSDRLAILRRELKSRDADRRRLEKLRDDSRMTTSSWWRTILAIVTALVWCFGLLGLSHLVRIGAIEGSALENLVFGFLWLAYFVALRFGFRKESEESLAFDRIMNLSICVAIAAILNRVLSVLDPKRSFVETLLADHLLIGVALLAIAVIIERRAWVPPLLAALSAVLVVLWPYWALETAAGASLLVSLWFAWFVRPGTQTET